MSVSSDDFLKALYLAEARGEELSGTDLAAILGITPSAVTRLTRRLAEEGKVDFRPYRGPELSRKGRVLAASLIRKHRLWELFLSTVLKMPWKEVHEEAEKLEHITSDELVNYIDDYLGHPGFDPHGQPIPDRKGTLPASGKQQALSTCTPGRAYTLARISDRSHAMMEHFGEMGLRTGIRVTVLEKIAFDGSVIISFGSRKTMISPGAAKSIFVEA